MADKSHVELLLSSWVKLDELKGMISAVVKGLDYEIVMEQTEMRSVLSISIKLISEVIEDINENIV